MYEVLKKPINIDKIVFFVKHYEECMRSFLRRDFDGEGCITKDVYSLL
ncbi:MAG: hypothetical protein QXE61_07240 [Nitrososphaerota archaeon]